MYKLGYKVFLNNLTSNKILYIQMLDAMESGVFDYIELYATPGSLKKVNSHMIEAIGQYPVLIHAPHMGHNMNPSDIGRSKENIQLLEDSFRAADAFNAEQIVIHGGMDKDRLDDNIIFFNKLDTSRLAIENLPRYAKTGDEYVSSKPEDIAILRQETGMKFCLDFSHAVCAALDYGREPLEFIEELQALRPTMYHLCDGLMDVAIDFHWHLKTGDFPIEHFLKMVGDKPVSLETGFGVPCNMYSQIQDAKHIRSL